MRVLKSQRSKTATFRTQVARLGGVPFPNDIPEPLFLKLFNAQEVQKTDLGQRLQNLSRTAAVSTAHRSHLQSFLFSSDLITIRKRLTRKTPCDRLSSIAGKC
jgi:hypothetical protein